MSALTVQKTIPPVNSVLCGDSLSIMETWEDNSVDVIITSPPYNLTGLRGFLKHPHLWHGDMFYNNDLDGDNLNEADYRDWQVKILNEFHRILKPKGSVFYNHKVRIARNVGHHPLEWIFRSNLTFRQQIIWDRGSAVNIDNKRFIPSTESIFWLTKTPCTPNFVRPKGYAFKTEVWRFNPEQKNDHPAPFPEALPRTILKCIPGDVLVLDPFCGSGTVLKVAQELGKRFVGIDKYLQYVETSRKRLSNLK